MKIFSKIKEDCNKICSKLVSLTMKIFFRCLVYSSILVFCILSWTVVVLGIIKMYEIFTMGAR